jgi:hypothetical protein
VLGQGVSALDLCMVLAKIFRVQYTEVALMRLEQGSLHFVFPEYLRTSGAIPLSSKAVAAHTALSKKAEIFNNFARVKHASIFETIKPAATDSDEPIHPSPIQKLMSVPIMDQDSVVVGVIQISRKGARSEICAGFQPRGPARPGVGGWTSGNGSGADGELNFQSKARFNQKSLGTTSSRSQSLFRLQILQRNPQIRSPSSLSVRRPPAFPAAWVKYRAASRSASA